MEYRMAPFALHIVQISKDKTPSNIKTGFYYKAKNFSH